MDNKMIERVSKAINEASQPPGQKNYDLLMRNCAIAAIRALREPTEKMLALGPEVQCWPEVIDFIIGDK